MIYLGLPRSSWPRSWPREWLPEFGCLQIRLGGGGRGTVGLILADRLRTLYHTAIIAVIITFALMNSSTITYFTVLDRWTDIGVQNNTEVFSLQVCSVVVMYNAEITCPILITLSILQPWPCSIVKASIDVHLLSYHLGLLRFLFGIYCKHKSL